MAQMASALLMDAKMVFTLVVSAPSIVPNQSALGNGAPRPLLQGEGVCIIPAKRSALLLAVATMPKQGVFVVHMVHVGFALLKAAMLVSMLVDYAKRMVANQSALGSGAPQPSNQKEGASNTAVATQKCAR